MSVVITYTHCPACGATDCQKVLAAKDYTVSKETFEIWQCPTCSLRFTQYAPAAASVGAYYQSEDYVSHTDTKEGLINQLYHGVRKITLQQKCKLIKKQTGSAKGMLLDVGAGTGAFAASMQQAGWLVTGLEPDAATRQRAKDLNNIVLEPAPLLYSLPAAAYDAITLWHVLEHVHDLKGYLQQFSLLLKPGGVLFIAVPNYTSHDAEVYKQYWAAYDVPRHLYHFSPAAVKELVQLYGLEVKKVKPMWFDSFYIAMLSEQYKHNKPGLMRAVFTGFVSNLKALFNMERCSSIIYIIHKKS
ncbi:MAG: class I SAM-dependent methyltransferase [Sphingobacteriales bacterium]|nr:MAG: class I SAM-dependent methyltransferase [Sphingobacteriales bacterium]